MNTELTTGITPESLQNRLRDQRDLFHEEHSTRLHRAISWWRAALEQDGNPDLQFITAWVSLNACCLTSENLSEEMDFLPLIQRVVALDKEQAIYNMLWHEYSGPVKALIKNPYVYAPFWAAQRGQCDDWKTQFERSSVEALNYLSRKRIAELLSLTLDRLNVLHNQVLCGGATYQSRVNREQVETGVQLLMSLLPVMLEIMLVNPDEEWGELAYPIVG
jgi:hypothetical protein